MVLLTSMKNMKIFNQHALMLMRSARWGLCGPVSPGTAPAPSSTNSSLTFELLNQGSTEAQTFALLSSFAIFLESTGSHKSYILDKVGKVGWTVLCETMCGTSSLLEIIRKWVDLIIRYF